MLYPIFSCHWLGEECNLTRDFKISYTDLGVCYTFNYDPDDVKFVDDTAYGLRMMLNVEQYEHMKGPTSDAGIRVTLSRL